MWWAHAKEQQGDLKGAFALFEEAQTIGAEVRKFDVYIRTFLFLYIHVCIHPRVYLSLKRTSMCLSVKLTNLALSDGI